MYPPDSFELFAQEFTGKLYRLLTRWYGAKVAYPPADWVSQLATAARAQQAPWWVIQATGSYLARRGPNQGLNVPTVEAFAGLLGKLVAEASKSVCANPAAWFPLRPEHFDDFGDAPRTPPQPESECPY